MSPGDPDEARVDGLVIQLPRGWTVRPVPDEVARQFHYVRPLAFVGTGASTATCVDVPGGTDCRLDRRLSPETLSLMIARGTGPGSHESIWERTNLDGMRRFEVGVLPALAGPLDTPTQPGEDAEARWELSVPGNPRESYYLTAAYRGRDVAAQHALVGEIVSRITYDPPAVPLPTGAAGDAAAARAAAAALAVLREDPAFACFPPTPGSQSPATVRALPFWTELTRPLAVTCRTEIEPTPLQTWQMHLVARWDADAGHPAGWAGAVVDVLPDGSPGTARGAGEGTPPYLPPAD